MSNQNENPSTEVINSKEEKGAKVSFFKKIGNFFKMIGIAIYHFFKNPTVLYILRRIGSSLVTLFLVATVVFLLLRIIPKENYLNIDAMNKMSSEAAKEVYRQTIYKQYGFDKPLIVQLAYFWRDIIPVIPHRYCLEYKFVDNTFSEMVCKPGESKIFWMYLGQSKILEKNKTIWDILGSKMPISFGISIISTLITYIIGYPLGVMMAKNKGKLVDKLGNGYIILSLALPSLIFYCIIWLLFMKMGLGATFSPSEKNYAVLIGPIFAMVFLSVPGQAMWVRRFMVDEGDADYVKFARSKGLSENRIMFTHVLRNAAVPLVRNFPAAFVGSIIGSYYAESVWSIPGTGRLLITAMNAQKPDNELVQGLTIVYAAISMIAFLLGDIVTVFADPRIKLTK